MEDYIDVCTLTLENGVSMLHIGLFQYDVAYSVSRVATHYCPLYLIIGRATIGDTFSAFQTAVIYEEFSIQCPLGEVTKLGFIDPHAVCTRLYAPTLI